MAKKDKQKKMKHTARTSDRYVLYTESVQSPDCEIDFFRRVYRKRNGRPPVMLREDFCGTAAICCRWTQRGSANRAVGVDLDPEPLDWCRSHYVPDLTDDQRQRLDLIQDDVLKVGTAPADVILALNFSFCVFKQRSLLMQYLQRCRQAMAADGIMVMDIYGGPESQKTNKDVKPQKGFTYIWDQAKYNPITNEALNHIHFHFRDGTKMKRAFTYDWRLWTPAELSEALLEAGFDEARVYWEGSDKDGEGNGVFRPAKSADVEDAWVAYIVGFA